MTAQPAIPREWVESLAEQMAEIADETLDCMADPRKYQRQMNELRKRFEAVLGAAVAGGIR